MADIEAVRNVIKSWKPKPVGNPEAISSPKEFLSKLSRGSNKKPRYDHTTHNEKVAEYLDINRLLKKCPSFQPLATFVRGES